MLISLRKSASDTSAPSLAFICHTLFAHCSKAMSWVPPRSSVTASNSLRPGDLRLVLGSPPSRCLTTSVIRFSAETLLMPATYRPSQRNRNLKFLYGSKRWGLTTNSAMSVSFNRLLHALASDLQLARELLDLD